MALQWFKFYGAEYLSDPKISSMTPQERSCWLSLLCLASSSSEVGKIEFLTIDGLLEMSGIKWDPYNPEEWEKAQGVLTKLERMKMIKVGESGIVTVLNWNKRQEHNLTVAERVAKHRQKAKTVTTNVTNVTTDKNRIEYNRKNTDIVASDKKDFSLKEEIQKLYDNTRRDLNIIGLYFEYRNPPLENKEQYNIALKRHLKAAKDLVPFSDNQIIKAIDYAKKEYKDIYTLETLIKILSK